MRLPTFFPNPDPETFPNQQLFQTLNFEL
jgi:hypothetical protein